jgi:hypothetical protein
MLRARQEEQQFFRRVVPQEQVNLEATRRRNAELEERIQELQLQVQDEEAKQEKAERDWLQERSKRSNIEKAYYSHTCYVDNATVNSVCLKFRGNIKLWVERTDGKECVSVNALTSPIVMNNDPCTQIEADLGRSLLACAWNRILVSETGRTTDKPVTSPSTGEVSPQQTLKATVPCKEIPFRSKDGHGRTSFGEED